MTDASFLHCNRQFGRLNAWGEARAVECSLAYKRLPRQFRISRCTTDAPMKPPLISAFAHTENKPLPGSYYKQRQVFYLRFIYLYLLIIYPLLFFKTLFHKYLTGNPSISFIFVIKQVTLKRLKKNFIIFVRLNCLN